MKEFFIKAVFFLGINLCILTLLIILGRLTEKRLEYDPGDTESSLLAMRKGAEYGFVLLGTSHGRVFSRGSKQPAVEKLLDKSFFNLSKGSGAGIIPAKIYLTQFFNDGNRTPLVVYLIDPWIFYSSKWNEKNYFPASEPFSVAFLKGLILNGIHHSVIINYFKTKIEAPWFLKHPQSINEPREFLVSVDASVVRARLNNLYQDGQSPESFRRYAPQVDEIVSIARDHDAKMIFIVPPTLLGDLPGVDLVRQKIDEYAATGDAEFYDFSNAIADPRLYYDHDHLNRQGVNCFAKNFLKPILDGVATASSSSRFTCD